MENKTNLNIPSVTVDELIDVLTGVYANAIRIGMDLRSIPTPFLWGAAGIGKSDAVKQIAESLQKETGKTVSVTDVRLLLFTPTDLMGMPVIIDGKTVWTRPKIFDMNPDSNHINILFLDELSSVQGQMQAAAYQICLDRCVGEHKLPDNCIVFAAGNRVTDKSISYKMPKALCNRCMHFDVKTTFEAWTKWAKNNNINPSIVSYLGFDNERLCKTPDHSDLAYTTPRSWAFVSNLMNTVTDKTPSKHKRLLVGACVGMDTALELQTWINSGGTLPKTEDILDGRSPNCPKDADVIYTVVSSLISDILKRKDEISIKALDNACAYVARFSNDMVMMFYSELNADMDIKLKLLKSPAARNWISQNKW